MARANRPTSSANGHTNGHFHGNPKINGKGRFVWPDSADWRDVRDAEGPVSRNGHGRTSGAIGNGSSGGSPNGQRAPAEKTYLRPSDIQIDTPGQVAFARALKTQRITWGIGSSGSGKTCLAVRDAVEKLQSGRVRRIVLTRPAVEAGDSLGFQPGDTNAKISGFMIPMLEELARYYSPADIKKMRAEGVIQTVAFQFMRGLNFQDTAFIVDEAHNASAKHVQLALQRLCRGSTYAILGDLERNNEGHPDGPTLKQSDLPPGLQGGLEYWIRQLHGIPGIVRVDMTPLDCHRDPLVKAMQARGL